MSKKNLIIVVLIVCAVGGGAVIATESIGLSSAYAERGDTAMRKTLGYEYCAVTNVFSEEDAGKITGTASICYIRDNRYDCEKLTSTLSGPDDPQEMGYRAQDSALLKAIGKLGSDGWEMVGDGFPFGTRHKLNADRALYFKRLRR